MSDDILASDNQQETQHNQSQNIKQTQRSRQGQEQGEQIGSRMQRQLVLPQTSSFLEESMKDKNESEEKENHTETAVMNGIMKTRDSQSSVEGKSFIGNRKNSSQNSQKNKRELKVNDEETKCNDQSGRSDSKDIAHKALQGQTNEHENEREPESWIIVDPEKFHEINLLKSKNSEVSLAPLAQDEETIINSEERKTNPAELSQEVGQIRMTFQEFMEKQTESQQKAINQEMIHRTSFFAEQPAKKDEKETVETQDISFKNLKDSIKEIGRYQNSSKLRDQGKVKNIEESAEEVFKKILKSSSQVSSRQQLESSNSLAKQFQIIGSDGQLEEKGLAFSGVEQAKRKENAKSGIISKKQNTKRQLPSVNYWNQNYEKNKQNLAAFLEKNRKKIRGFVEEKGFKQQNDPEGEYQIAFRQLREYLAQLFEKESFKILESEESPVDVLKNKNIAAIMSTVLREYVRSCVKEHDEEEQEQENQKVDEKTYLITSPEMEIFLDFWFRVDEQLVIVYQQEKDQVKSLLEGSIVQWENAKASSAQGNEQSVISATLQFLKEQYKHFEVKILHTNVKKSFIEKLDQSEIEAGILKIFKEYASVLSKNPTFDEIRESSKFMNLNNYFRFAKDYGISSILQGADIIGLFHKNCTGKNMSFQQFVCTLYKIVQSTTQTIAPQNSSDQANIAIARLLKLKSSNSTNEDPQLKKEQSSSQPKQIDGTSKFLVRRSLSPKNSKNPLNYNKPRSQPLDTDTDKINWQQIDKLSYQQVNDLWANKEKQSISKSKSSSSKALIINNKFTNSNSLSPEKRILKQKYVNNTDPAAPQKNDKEQFFNPNDLINHSEHDLNEALDRQYRITGQIKAQGLPLIKLPLITHNLSEKLPQISQPLSSLQLVNSSKNLPENTPVLPINQVRTIKQSILIPKAKSTSPMRNDKDTKIAKPSIFTNANRKSNIQVIKGNNSQPERQNNLTEMKNNAMFMENEFLNYHEPPPPPFSGEISQIPNGNQIKPAVYRNYLYQPNANNPQQDFQMNYNQPAQPPFQPQPTPIQQFVQSRVFYGIQPLPYGSVNSKVPSSQSPSPLSSRLSPSNSSGSPTNSSQPQKQIGKVNQQQQQLVPPQQSQFFPTQQMQAHSMKQPQGYAFQQQQKQQQQQLQLITQQQPQQQNYLPIPQRKNQQNSFPMDPPQPGFVRVVPAWQHQQQLN